MSETSLESVGTRKFVSRSYHANPSRDGALMRCRPVGEEKVDQVEDIGDVDLPVGVGVSRTDWARAIHDVNGPSPIGPADANADGQVNVADIFYLINFLFANGPAPH